MSNYGQHFSTQKTPQNEQARPDQVKNNAGGFVFKLDCWGRLDRWLILGAEGATYYATEQKLVRDNCKSLQECLKADGIRTVERIIAISVAGRAPKNDPAIFALAMAAGDPNVATRQAALAALPKVCRIGTHLFHFFRDCMNFRGKGSALRKAVANWYRYKAADSLAYDLLKYQSRDGWGHRDLIRLSHPVARTVQSDAAFRWAVKADQGERVVRRGKAKDAPTKTYGAFAPGNLPVLLQAYPELLASTDATTTARLIRQYGFTHEMVPGERKGSVEVWEALLENMPQTALIRNLGKMTSVGVFKPLSDQLKRACDQLVDVEKIKKQRVHPIAILKALMIYQQGHGDKGSLTWNPAREIVDALDAAFYASFQTVEPTGKKHLLAIDISGSMDTNFIANIPGLTARTAAAAMALVTARVEKQTHLVAFTAASGGTGGRWGGGQPGLTPLEISPRERLDDVCHKMRKMMMGGTDCSLPMLYAAAHGLEVDAFCTYTDNETWANPQIQPFQALRGYRQKFNRESKLVVVGMTATEFSIAPPEDPYCLDVCGFDAAAPAVMADFIRGDQPNAVADNQSA